MESSSDQRILVLTPRFPYPLKAGDTLRIYYICRALADKYSLTLLSICETEEEMEAEPADAIFDRIERVYHSKWRARFQTAKAFLTGEPLQLAYYQSDEFAERIEALKDEHDLILGHLCRTGQYIEGQSDVLTVLEMTDALSLNYERVRSQSQWGIQQAIYWIEAPRMEHYEKATIDGFDLVSLVSPVDRQFLLEDRDASGDHVRVYTNGIDLEKRPFREPGKEPVMVFIGNMRTVHNRMSCQYVATEIIPRVRREIPDMCLRIVGAAPPSTKKAFNEMEGVTVTGWVDSIPEAVRGAVCGVGVMQVGGGLQNKILEYMALGLPVVANEIGVEGIDLEDGEEAIVENDPDRIANQIVRLYHSEKRRNQLARNARDFVEANHQWSMALRGLVRDIHQLLAS